MTAFLQNNSRKTIIFSQNQKTFWIFPKNTEITYKTPTSMGRRFYGFIQYCALAIDNMPINAVYYIGKIILIWGIYESPVEFV